ncbi:MAG: hypothetical protein GYB21_12305 [Oceanospirillales bacterium]|nr:hypothetical protein [Oceanospirillales bacterium]
MIKFLQHQAFALLGAIGILALVDSLIQLPKYLAQWVNAWQEITRPVWEFLLGWIFSLFDMSVPFYVSDYFTMAAITAGACFKVIKADEKEDHYDALIFISLLWPLAIYLVFRKGNDMELVYILLEVFIYAAIIVAIFYSITFLVV